MIHYCRHELSFFYSEKKTPNSRMIHHTQETVRIQINETFDSFFFPYSDYITY